MASPYLRYSLLGFLSLSFLLAGEACGTPGKKRKTEGEPAIAEAAPAEEASAVKKPQAPSLRDRRSKKRVEKGHSPLPPLDPVDTQRAEGHFKQEQERKDRLEKAKMSQSDIKPFDTGADGRQ